MKATDLMIGDWVQFPNSYEKVREISYVDGIGMCASFAASATLFPVNIERIKPIPLTPEILEKNGIKYSEWYGWQIKEPDFTLCFVGDTPHFLLDDIFVCYCPYVHTFQHALRLCGIEKEIVL